MPLLEIRKPDCVGTTAVPLKVKAITMPKLDLKYCILANSTPSVPGVDVVISSRARRYVLWHSRDDTTTVHRSLVDHYGGPVEDHLLGNLPVVGQELFILGHVFKVVTVHCEAGSAVYIVVESCTSQTVYDLSVERYVHGCLPVFQTARTREHRVT